MRKGVAILISIFIGITILVVGFIQVITECLVEQALGISAIIFIPFILLAVYGLRYGSERYRSDLLSAETHNLIDRTIIAIAAVGTLVITALICIQAYTDLCPHKYIV